MTAELLARAAKVLREHAEVAMPGKWLSLDAGDRLIAVQPDDDFEYLVTEEPARHGETADYIALMHPPVALALADWLDAAAIVLEANYGAGVDLLAEIDDDQTAQHAVIIARAVLREEPS